MIDDDEEPTNVDQDGGDNTNATTIDEFDDDYWELKLGDESWDMREWPALSLLICLFCVESIYVESDATL